MNRYHAISALLLALAVVGAGLAGQSMKVDTKRRPMTETEVTFKSAGLTLHGYLYKPGGDGPFPAMVWNHGSEKYPADVPDLGKYYTDKGFVLFVPHRHGQGRSPGPYIIDMQDAYAKTHKNQHDRARYDVELQELYNTDVLSAVDWLKDQKYVDKGRIFMSGVSYGGIQTLITARKGHVIKAALPFASCAMSWSVQEFRDLAKSCTIKSKVPLALIQAHNDYSIGPFETLSPLIKARGKPNRAALYPNFGAQDDHNSGHYLFATTAGGTVIWGGLAMDFMNDVAPHHVAPPSTGKHK